MIMNEAIRAGSKRFKKLASTDLLIRHCLKDSDGSDRVYYEVGAVKRMVGHLDWMERSVKRIAKTKKEPWESQYFGGKSRCWMTGEAKDLWHVFRNIQESPKELVAGRKLNPWLEVGLHLAYKWEPRLRFFINGNGNLSVDEEYPRRMLSHIVKVIRRVCNSKRFRGWVKNHYRGAEDNYRRSAEYILAILRVHARLLVLRVDLYFEGDAKEISGSEEADRAYDKFMRNLSTSNIAPDVLGYVGKREDGLDRRIHYHILVLIDGSEHQQAHNLTEMLGRFWVNDCVGSSILSSYKNCYERKNEYEFNCLGLLHYTDDRMLMGLREALEYICKERAHVLARKGKERNLRKGQPPRLPDDGRRRGAPRKYGNDVLLAERILLTKSRSESRTRLHG
ncbi:MAG: hypothetical protein ACREO4_14355 [Lysobacter sp.]